MRKLLYFYADWCRPCRNNQKTISEVEQQVPLERYNVDRNPNITQQYGVTSVPTVLVIDNGQVVARYTGNQSAATLIQAYKQG
jgi:thioredoxin-like negative regulator of GroEL